MRELSVPEQRYQAVMAVIGDGLTVSQAAEKTGVARQTLHRWLARYEAEGLEGLRDRSHRPVRCPHQMGASVEAVVELRRSRPYWGPRRLVFELATRRVAPVPSEPAVYRALLRAGMIDPADRDRRSRKWKRWERGAPMELWQMDIVVSVAWQQVCVGAHYAGSRCDVHVDGDLLRFFIGDDLVKTAARTSRAAVRNKRAFRTREQA
jgi:transposase